MILCALLLGSDYTPGVKGVGVVNALEVLQVFPGTASHATRALHSCV